MSIFKKLISNSTIEELDNCIEKNIDKMEEISNLKYSDIIEYKQDVEEFILMQIYIIEKLNFNTSYNKAFIALLIDICERLGLVASISQIYNIYTSQKLFIGKRLESTLLYLNNIQTNDKYIDIIENICENIEYSIFNEEDYKNKPIATFLNYYAYVIYNTQPHKKYIENFYNKIYFLRKSKKYSFLDNAILLNNIQIDVRNVDSKFIELKNVIDILLDKTEDKNIYNQSLYLIESNTTYANKLKNISSNILDIRQLSCNLSNNSKDTFYSLGRGVTILDQEQQLYSYLKSYGNMHFAKCNYAYNFLSENFFDKHIDIIDWGCGQALASMTYLDFLNTKNIKQNINKITLIEPSEIALKRGALHIKKMNNSLDILTINKDLNSLINSDFNNSNNVKLHIFSNILDIDDYSTTKLANLIKEQFNGLNYFIIVSPKITDLKTNRIDKFVKEFQILDFEILESTNKGVGEWLKNWTLVLRIFKVSNL